MKHPRTGSSVSQQQQLPLSSHCVGRQSRQADNAWPQAERERWSPIPTSSAGYLLPQRPSPGPSYERLQQRATPFTNSEWPVNGRSPSMAELISPRGRAVHTAREDMLFAHTPGGARASASADRGVVRDSSVRNRCGDADPGVLVRDNSRCRTRMVILSKHRLGIHQGQ